VGHVMMTVDCLSVSLSVPGLSRELKRVGNWKLAGKKPGHLSIRSIRVTCDPILRSKGQRSRPPGRLMPWPKINHILWTGRPIRTSDLVSGWSTKSHTVTSNLKVVGGCSSHHLDGAGAYRGGATTSENYWEVNLLTYFTGRTVCR